jgi:hypothetical protein
MRVDGMLHPLLVRPHPDRPGYYHLVAGRHRFYVTSKVLKSETVECRVLADMDDAEARMTALTENVCRTVPKSSIARLTLISEWATLFAEKYPDKMGRKSAAKARWANKAEEAKAEEATEEVAEEVAESTTDACLRIEHASEASESAEPAAEAVAETVEPRKSKAKAKTKEKGGEGTFIEQVAKTIGKSRQTVHRDLRVTNGFPEDQSTLLLKLGSTQTDLLQILDFTPNDVPSRNQIVSLVASGMKVDQAIATVIGAANETEPSSEVVTDDDWYMSRCYEPFGKHLANDTQFRRDAILYRHTIDAIGKLRKATKKTQEAARAEAKGGNVGWFFFILSQITHLSHPRNWLICGTCGGNGLVDPGVACPACKGACYRIKTEKIG